MDQYITILGETHPDTFAKVFSITLDTNEYPPEFTPTQMLEDLFSHGDFRIDIAEKI